VKFLWTQLGDVECFKQKHQTLKNLTNRPKDKICEMVTELTSNV